MHECVPNDCNIASISELRSSDDRQVRGLCSKPLVLLSTLPEKNAVSSMSAATTAWLELLGYELEWTSRCNQLVVRGTRTGSNLTWLKGLGN